MFWKTHSITQYKIKGGFEIIDEKIKKNLIMFLFIHLNFSDIFIIFFIHKLFLLVISLKYEFKTI